MVAAGHKAIAVQCNVSDDAQVAAMVERTVAEIGRLDAAFNNVVCLGDVETGRMRTRPRVNPAWPRAWLWLD